MVLDRTKIIGIVRSAGSRLPQYSRPLLLGIAGPLLLVPNPIWIVGMILVAIPIFQVLLDSWRRARYRGVRALLSPDSCMLLLLMMSIVGLVVSEDPTVSLSKFQGLFFAAGAYFSVSHYALSLERATKVSALLSAGSIGIVSVALFGTEWQSRYSKTSFFWPIYDLLPQAIRDVPASHGITAGFHPNEVSGVLAPLILLAAGTLFVVIRNSFLHTELKKAVAAVVGASIFLGSAYVLLSVSRNAWLSLGIAVLATSITILLKRSPRMVVPLLILVAVISLGVWQSRGSAGENFLSDSDLTWEQDPSAWGQPMRPQIWQRALQMISDHPVTGIGLNMFPYVVQTRYPFEWFNDYFVPHAHNLYLQTAVDYGLPGLLSFLGLVSLSLAGVIKALKCRSGLEGFSLGVFGALLSMLVFGMLDTVAVGAKPSFLLFSIIGLGVAVGKIGDSAASSSANVPKPERRR